MKPKPGGLFDTGATDVTRASASRLTSVDSVDFNFADDTAADMIATLKKGALATDEDTAAAMATTRLFSAVSDSSDILSLEGDFDFSGNADFCEVFTDLSQMLQENGQEDMALAMEPEPLPQVMEQQPAVVVQAVKRTATEALLDVGLTPHVPNPDHSDYTTKNKRRKTSHASSLADAAADVAMTTDDTQPCAGTSKDQKYLERRRKNNIASKRSRETRKQKHSSLQDQANLLEKQNEALRLKVDQLEKLAKEMKDTLIQKLAHQK